MNIDLFGEPIAAGSMYSAPGCSTTPDQFFLQMQKIREEVGDDEEIAHARMDDLMCRVLVELGYRDGVGVFNMQEKWYA